MDKMPDARFWLPLHPVCAQYKTLISDICCDLFPLCVLMMVSYNEMVSNC